MAPSSDPTGVAVASVDPSSEPLLAHWTSSASLRCTLKETKAQAALEARGSSLQTEGVSAEPPPVRAGGGCGRIVKTWRKSQQLFATLWQCSLAKQIALVPYLLTVACRPKEEGRLPSGCRGGIIPEGTRLAPREARGKAKRHAFMRASQVEEPPCAPALPRSLRS